jgi:ADP-ribose pyrophosphatase YjhB (NUDIX family)
MRLAYRIGYRALTVWVRVAQPRTRGVKCLLRDDAGRALFVRHTYGARECWEIPGGGVRAGEPLAGAARREAFEELGADVTAWDELATVRGAWYGKDEQLTVLAARWPGGAPRPDPVEIAAVAWFALGDPPSPLGRTTVAALDAIGEAGEAGAAS